MRLSLRWLRRITQDDAEAILAAAREDDAEDHRAAQQRILDQAARTTAPGVTLGPDTPTLGVPIVARGENDKRGWRRNRGRW